MLTTEIHPKVTDEIKRQTVKEVLQPLLPVLGIRRLAVTASVLNVTIGDVLYTVNIYSSSPSRIADQLAELVSVGCCDDLVSVRKVKKRGNKRQRTA